MIVCHCRVVSCRSIGAAVEAGATSLASVCSSTGAGQDCGGCVFAVKRVVLDKLVTTAAATSAAAAAALAGDLPELTLPA